MDGFRDRDRMNRGSSDRGSYDRYDRYSRSGRGGSYGAPESVSADEIAGIIDDSNAKQLDIIHDFIDDVKADTLDSEKHIISAIEGLSKGSSSDNSSSNKDEILKSGAQNKTDIVNSAAQNKEEILSAILENRNLISSISGNGGSDSSNEELLRIANSNNDLLAGFAEEQLSMLVRGNSSTLNQISQSMEERAELLQQILDKTNSISEEISNISSNQTSTASSTDTSSSYGDSYSNTSDPYANTYAQDYYSQRTAGPVTDDNSEAILNVATNNGTMLNAIRSDIATVQQQLRDLETDIENLEKDNAVPVPEPPRVEETAPLDAEDTLTKSQADEMYKQLEEHVHSECVKVYRNFQKTLEDQNKAVLDGVGKGGSGARIFALLAFIVGIFNLIVTFLQIYGIL